MPSGEKDLQKEKNVAKKLPPPYGEKIAKRPPTQTLCPPPPAGAHVIVISSVYVTLTIDHVDDSRLCIISRLVCIVECTSVVVSNMDVGISDDLVFIFHPFFLARGTILHPDYIFRINKRHSI